jgi:ABC-2 type transport system ATP-binding protein
MEGEEGMDHPIEIKGLKKAFQISPHDHRSIFQKAVDYLRIKKDRIVIFDSLDMKIKKGEIYCLLGQNGSGKTTLIRILSGTVLPDGGKALVNGLDVADSENKDSISKSLGVMLGERSRSFYWRLTARQNLEFYATLYNLDRKKQKERVDYLLDFVGLGDRKGDYVYSFSTGMLNRLAIARAFLHSPKILLLDEFMGNLDPKATFEIRNVIKKLAKTENRTVLFTTNNAYEAEYLSDRVGVLHKGRLIAEGSVGTLRRKFGTKEAKIIVTLEKLPKDVKKFSDALKAKGKAKGIKIEKNVITIKTENPVDCCEKVFKILRESKATPHDIEILPASLENAFINIIERDGHGI